MSEKIIDGIATIIIRFLFVGLDVLLFYWTRNLVNNETLALLAVISTNFAILIVRHDDRV